MRGIATYIQKCTHRHIPRYILIKNKNVISYPFAYDFQALELNPFDKNALVARSKCHLLMGNAHLALKDAEQALTEDKNFIKGKLRRAVYAFIYTRHQLVTYTAILNA